MIKEIIVDALPVYISTVTYVILYATKKY